MGKQLDIQPQTVSFGSVTDLLNPAFSSLSGPVGFLPTQPHIHVKKVTVTNPSTTVGVVGVVYKGASGGNAPGTQLFVFNINALETLVFYVGTVLEATDFLTGAALSSGSVVINIDAEIEF